jgi:MEMO1 family protein
MITIRKASAAGRFYPADEKSLHDFLEKLHAEERSSASPIENQEILGGIVPHAGYMYSGKTALHFFESLSQKDFVFDTAIILSPNHTGWGPELALDGHEAWETPLGLVEIDQDFFPFLNIEPSSEAHQIEHSAEVVVPMLQYFFKKGFKILPINMWDQSPATARSLAMQLVTANKKLGKKIIVIASTDFSHYVSPEYGREQDDLALERIARMDINGLARVIHQEDISICGYGPIMTLMAMAKLLFDKPFVKILDRSHSGQSVASKEVVHYVSAVICNAAS